MVYIMFANDHSEADFKFASDLLQEYIEHNFNEFQMTIDSEKKRKKKKKKSLMEKVEHNLKNPEKSDTSNMNKYDEYLEEEQTDSSDQEFSIPPN